MFYAIVQSFNENHKAARCHDAKIDDKMAKALFLFLDYDDSGELEQEEVIEVLQDRQLLGQNR